MFYKTPIRNKLKQFNITIRPPKRFDQGQKSLVTHYVPIKNSKKEITFRSLLELGYAMLLDQDPEIKVWDYEVMWMYYYDGFTGKQRKYICDFRIEYNNDLVHDGDIEYKEKKIIHVEVKPLFLQTNEDKFLYAQNTIPNWRFITNEEIIQVQKILDTLNLDRKFPKKILRRKIKERRINDIIRLIKQDKTAKEIGKIYNCDYRTITRFLEDNSIVVRWSGNSKRGNEIRIATRRIL
jgi:hypothetical protein